MSRITKTELMAIIEPIVDTLVRKNHDYGGSVFELGSKGIFVRMWDKMARLKQLVWYSINPQVNDESSHDTITDLVGYGILWLVLNRRNAEVDAFVQGEMSASELNSKFAPPELVAATTVPTITGRDGTKYDLYATPRSPFTGTEGI